MSLQVRSGSISIWMSECGSDKVEISPVLYILALCPQRHSSESTGLTSGDQSAVEPPGPFPNPEVKRRSADGIGTIGPVRVGRCQVNARLQEIGVGLFFWLSVRFACDCKRLVRLQNTAPLSQRSSKFGFRD